MDFDIKLKMARTIEFFGAAGRNATMIMLHGEIVDVRRRELLCGKLLEEYEVTCTAYPLSELERQADEDKHEYRPEQEGPATNDPFLLELRSGPRKESVLRPRNVMWIKEATDGREGEDEEGRYISVEPGPDTLALEIYLTDVMFVRLANMAPSHYAYLNVEKGEHVPGSLLPQFAMSRFSLSIGAGP